MKYFKFVDEGNYISCAGMNFTDEIPENCAEITEIEYIRIVSKYTSTRAPYGKMLMLNNDTMQIEEIDVEVPDDAEISDEDAMNIILGNI